MMSIRPFGCEECSSTFTRSENLERHKRTRHGDAARKSFQCPHCQAKFARRDICKRHANRCQEKSLQQSASYQSVTRASSGGGIHSQSEPLQRASSESEPSPSSKANDHNLRRKRRRRSSSPGIEAAVVGNGDAEGPDADASWHLYTTPHLSEPQPARNSEALVSPESISLGTSNNSVGFLVGLYFAYFHASLPIIHKATFEPTTAPRPLLNIMVAIGHLYSIKDFTDEPAATTVERSRRLWAQGVEELEKIRSSEWRELRKTWVMQAWLLHIVYGVYADVSAQDGTARRMLRHLVDAVRDLGLLNYAVAATMFPRIDDEMMASFNSSELGWLEDTWRAYLHEETLKLSLQALMFLDHHVFSSCNMRPLLSPIEFVWELPLHEELWEAKDALSWRIILTDKYGESAMVGTTLKWPIPLNRGSHTMSTSLATQSLMSESPCPQLIETLFASPMATLAVLTNIELLIKDFTRCYYQLPPNPSDPSAYHILTQGQNQRIFASLKVLIDITSTQVVHETHNEKPLWRACDMTARAIKLSLCRPDDLLICGIVESNVIATLMTATHLTLGSYVAARRSTQSLLKKRSDDEGALAITEDLVSALTSIMGASPRLAYCEGPWTTAISYRILLLIWKVLRWAVGAIREKLTARIANDDIINLPRSFGSCSLVLNSLLETIFNGEPESTAAASRQNSLWATDLQSLTAILDHSEADLTNLIIRICKSRPVWAIGSAMVSSIENITATTSSNVPLNIYL